MTPAVGQAAVRRTAVVLCSRPGANPAPCSVNNEGGNAPVEWIHHFVKRRHRCLEPVDQPPCAEGDHPGGDQGSETPLKECRLALGQRRFRACHEANCTAWVRRNAKRRIAFALTCRGCEALERFAGEAVSGPVVERHRAQARIEIDRKLVPFEHIPLHSAAIA